jgi:serine/threonine-protein kinase
MQTLPVEHLVGKTISETYQVEQFLGSGALTAAYAGQYTGHQHTHQQRVMITVFRIPEKFSADAQERFQARFLREAKLLASLEHKHILPVYAFGIQYDYPYLVIPFAQESSLARVLKDRERFSVEETSVLLTQIADGLDYAYRNGVVHGSLSPATVFLDEKHTVSIAGFGFVRVLAQQGIVNLQHQYAHLLNIANTFLGVPAYIAPECVQGAQPDIRADVYALGLMAFQLLSGTLPFSGNNPLEVALQRVQQPVPSLQAVVPDIPVALDLIVQRALEQEPSQRYQSAGELARSFARALNVLHGATKEPEAKVTTAVDSQTTQPPDVNWLGDMLGKTAKQPAIPVPSAQEDGGKWQLTPPIVTAQLPAIPATSIAALPIEDNVPSVDPFVWWSTMALPQVESQVPGTFTQKRTANLPSSRRKSTKKSRRQAIILLASGGIVAAGVLGVAGISLAHIMHTTAPLQVATGQSATTTQGNTPATSSSPTSTQKTGTSANGQAHTTPTAAHSQTPTAAPAQKAATTHPHPAATTYRHRDWLNEHGNEQLERV